MNQEDLPLCEEDSEASSYRRHLSDILGGGLLSVHKNQGKLPPCVKGLEKTSLCKGESREARRTRPVASSLWWVGAPSLWWVGQDLLLLLLLLWVYSGGKEKPARKKHFVWAELGLEDWSVILVSSPSFVCHYTVQLSCEDSQSTKSFDKSSDNLICAPLENVLRSGL